MEVDAADLLGKIYSVRGDKAKGRKWLKKAVGCRKEILDPKVKETEGRLSKKGKSGKGKVKKTSGSLELEDLSRRTVEQLSRAGGVEIGRFEQ